MDYTQDLRCPEGQKMVNNSCISDPAYDAAIAELEAELLQLDREERAIRLASQQASRDKLHQEMEAQRTAQERMISQRRQEEAEQIQKLAIYGVGGLGILTVITLIIMVILK